MHNGWLLLTNAVEGGSVRCANAFHQSVCSRTSLRLTEEWRVGGEAEDVFGQTAMTLVMPTGRVVMFEGARGRFVVFDSTRKRIGGFGGRGQGPGEFTSRNGRYTIEIGYRADTVWTYDRPQRRFALFGPDFGLVRTFPLPQVDAARALIMNVETVLAGDRLLARAVLVDERSGRSGALTDSALVVLGADGTVDRRVAKLPPDSSYARVDVPDLLARLGTVPYRSSPRIATSSNRDRVALVTHVTATQFRIVVVRPTGDTVFSRSYPYQAIPVTTQKRDNAMAIFRFESQWSTRRSVRSSARAYP